MVRSLKMQFVASITDSRSEVVVVMEEDSRNWFFSDPRCGDSAIRRVMALALE